MKNSNKILLFNPPFFSNRFPNLGLHSVKGSLDNAGFNSKLIDLNINFYSYLINNLIISGNCNKDREARDKYMRLLVQDEDNLILPNNFFFQLKFPQKEQTYLLQDGNDIIKFAQNIANNPYIKFFQDQNIIQTISENKTTHIGISIISLHQVIPALTLANYIKVNSPKTKIVLGGSWCSSIYKSLMENSMLSSFVDYIIINEGETAMVELIKKNKDITEIPNLIYLENGNFKISTKKINEETQNLPLIKYPQLDDYKLSFDGDESYKSLVYETRRGCYWDKCSFCMHRDGIIGARKEKDIKIVIDELKDGVLNKGSNCILFSDSAISPKRFKELSEAIIESGMKFDWWCFIRAERGFTKELFELGFKAGCKEIDVGIESVNDRISLLMNKGIQKKNAENIFKNAKESGIDVIVDFLVGFPTETIEECQENIDFISNNLQYLYYIGTNIFSLWRGTDIAENPEKYGVVLKDSLNSFNPEIPFDINRSKFPNSMTKNEIVYMASKMNLLNEKIIKQNSLKERGKYKIIDLSYDWNKVSPFDYKTSRKVIEFENGECHLLD